MRLAAGVTMATPNDRWASAVNYEGYVGRWSRRIAPRFLDWLATPAGLRWLDVGSGTGVLSEAILGAREPASIVGVDPSAPFVEHARTTVIDPRVTFRVGSAAETGLEDGAVDAAVAGLVLNFVPDLPAALAELRRVVAPGGWMGGFVWDYGARMEFMRRFWDAAAVIDPRGGSVDESTRFPIAAPGPLGNAVRDAGFEEVETGEIVIPTVFRDFDDLWSPFLAGTGPAPAYLKSVDEPTRLAIREQLRSSVTPASDGSIHLVARAWSVKSRRPR